MNSINIKKYLFNTKKYLNAKKHLLIAKLRSKQKNHQHTPNKNANINKYLLNIKVYLNGNRYRLPAVFSTSLHLSFVLIFSIITLINTKQPIKVTPSIMSAEVYQLTANNKPKTPNEKPSISSIKKSRTPPSIASKDPNKEKEIAEAKKKNLQKIAEEKHKKEQQLKSEQQRISKEIAEKKKRQLQSEKDQHESLKKQKLLDEMDFQAAMEREERQSLQQQQLEQQRIQEQQKELAIVSQYVLLIKALVQDAWTKPLTVHSNISATVQVRLTPTGEVINISMIRSSNNREFDNSVLEAVRKASPFREIIKVNSYIFERHFREFDLRFTPQDL